MSQKLSLLDPIFSGAYRYLPRHQVPIWKALDVLEAIQCKCFVDTISFVSGSYVLLKIDFRAHLPQTWVTLPFPFAICMAPYINIQVVAEKAGQILPAKLLCFSGYCIPRDESKKYMSIEEHSTLQGKRYQVTYGGGFVDMKDTRPKYSSTPSKL